MNCEPQAGGNRPFDLLRRTNQEVSIPMLVFNVVVVRFRPVDIFVPPSKQLTRRSALCACLPCSPLLDKQPSFYGDSSGKNLRALPRPPPSVRRPRPRPPPPSRKPAPLQVWIHKPCRGAPARKAPSQQRRGDVWQR